MPIIHNLLDMSMEAAYDETQTNSNIKSGDFLLVEDGIAMLAGACPVMLSGTSGVFHAYHDTESGRALRAAALARYEALEAAEAGEAPAPAAALILTKAQAEAIYSAMCVLNNVGGKVDAYVPNLSNPAKKGHLVAVREMGATTIEVRAGFAEEEEREDYRNQAAFAAAYGLGA